MENGRSHTLYRPLLDSTKSGISRSTKYTLILTLRWILFIIMWVLFIFWIGVIVLFPAHFMRKFLEKWDTITGGTPYGLSGSILLLLFVPVIIIALLGFIYIEISPKETHGKKKFKFPRPSSWTFPILIDGPFGVVNAAELIGIVMFVVYILWAMSAYLIRESAIINGSPLPSTVKRWVMLELSGLHLGSIGLFCLGFLFLPVARGSIILRLIDIPFEHATKYHVWLGHVTMAIFTAHGLCYLIAWKLEGRLQQEVVQWQRIGIANLPGEISLLAGLAMWVTSLRFVRQHYFELFFYTHQLYIVFVVFLALHVGDFIFCISAAGIFLFVLDRFLRFCQSRKNVGVLSAKSLPCGTVELVLSKPPSLRYNALSFVFLQIPKLSWLQWHPFSVSSSPYDGKHHLSILIKPLGKWTHELKNMVLMTKEQPQNDLVDQHPFKMNASVEGPYGHEADYHLSYDTLLLIAGGIGISPFVAILRDILHRIEQGQSGVPRNVLVIWAVKKSKELYILDLVDADSICPDFANKLCLEVQVYVTQELQPELENGDCANDIHSISYPEMQSKPMSSLVGTGNNIWTCIYMVLSVIGFAVTMGLTYSFYINRHNSTPWCLRGLCVILCMVAGAVVFGGLGVLLWDLWERKIRKHKGEFEDNKESGQAIQFYGQQKLIVGEGISKLVKPNSTHYGRRPNFRDVSSINRRSPLNNSLFTSTVGLFLCPSDCTTMQLSLELAMQGSLSIIMRLERLNLWLLPELGFRLSVAEVPLRMGI